jgi:hypothetical protein
MCDEGGRLGCLHMVTDSHPHSLPHWHTGTWGRTLTTSHQMYSGSQTPGHRYVPLLHHDLHQLLCSLH